VIRHLLGAHHDADQFVYDLQMLAVHPGALDELRERVRAVVEGRDPRAAWLRDLCVFEGYHEALLAGIEGFRGSRSDDPDIAFFAYLAWCARQPRTPADTWRAIRAGRFHPQAGLAA
jgi:hypothetical protein